MIPGAAAFFFFFLGGGGGCKFQSEGVSIMVDSEFRVQGLGSGVVRVESIAASVVSAL